jgi:hypothetical protein
VPNVFEELHQVLEELLHPESRRRRHLQRRLSAVEDHILYGAIEELMMALLLDAQEPAVWPLQILLGEAQRRSEGGMRPSGDDFLPPSAWDDSDPF